MISSGTTTAKLAEAFPNENVWLAAENGAYLRPPRALWDAFETAHEGSEWICLYENLNLSWVASVQQVRRQHACPIAGRAIAHTAQPVGGLQNQSARGSRLEVIAERRRPLHVCERGRGCKEV